MLLLDIVHEQGKVKKLGLKQGWLEQHPIVIACGKCGVSLSGKVDIGQMQPGLKFEFENADILNNDEKPDFIGRARTWNDFRNANV